MSQEQLVVAKSETPASIQKSEVLRRNVNSKVMQIERSIVIKRQQRAQAAATASAAIKEKVQVRIRENTTLCRTAEQRVRSIDDTVKETQLWITKLHHERYKQFAALQVTQRRLELRECNPPELNQDALQEALKIEERLLEKAREDFMAQEVKVKDIIKELTAIRARLSEDAAARRLAVSADRAILVNVAMAASVAPGARSMISTDCTYPSEVKTEAESRDDFKLSKHLEDQAQEIRFRSKEIIQQFSKECFRANERVEKRLTKRTEQTLLVTKELIGQGKEVDYTIVMAKRSLDQNHKFIDKKDQNQGKTYQAAQDMLVALQQERDMLRHDLSKKSKLLSTSVACRKVTPQVASSPPPAALDPKRKQRPVSAGASGGRKGMSGSRSDPCLTGQYSPAGSRSPTALPAIAPTNKKADSDDLPEAALRDGGPPEGTLPNVQVAEASSPTSFEGETVEPQKVDG